MTPKLNPSGISFDATEHRYFDSKGKELQGITSTIIQWMFPDTYATIPAKVLDAAKEHGSRVHSCIEMSSILGATEGCPESQEFLDLVEQNGMQVVSHEYIVSAFDTFASPIDVVLQDKDGGIWLGDIKTTSLLYESKVSLQLSIYALFFEMQNPSLRVKGIVEIWLPKQKNRKADYQGWQVLTRVNSEETAETVQAYLRGESPLPYKEYFEKPKDQLPAKWQSLISSIAENEHLARVAKRRAEEQKATLLEVFEEFGYKKFETPEIIITKTAPSIRKSVDSKLLQERYPLIYEECLKTSQVSSTIKITLKQTTT